MNRSGEQGFALPVAIFALVIAMTVIAAGTFVARQETKIGSAVRMGAEAFALAEAGVNEVLANWPVEALSEMAVWSDTTFVHYLASGTATTNVTRIDDRLYLIESVSDVTEGGVLLAGASRSAGLVVRMLTPVITPPAALTTRGWVDVRGNAEVHGEDLDPSEWGGLCGYDVADSPGVLIDDSTHVTTQGQGTVSGSPAVVEDPDLDDSTFTEFGGLTYAQLVNLADKTLPTGTINQTGPIVVDGECSTGPVLNWGDPQNPTAPCGGYFPMMHVPGNLRLQSGGVGQGILLVDGNLDLRGGFVFYGVIIVQGNIETQGVGNKIYGGVLASNATIEAQTLTGGSEIDFSTCSARRAVFNNSALTRPQPLARRSWIDMSAVRN